MDLLFKRYASPFLLIDSYIRVKRFSEFVKEFLNLREEDLAWETWLHKVHDKTYDQFKDEIKGINQNERISKEQIKTTIQDSAEMLGQFNPYEKG